MSVLFLIGSFKRKLIPRDRKWRERKGGWLTYSHVWKQEAVPCWQTVLGSGKTKICSVSKQHCSMMQPQSKGCLHVASFHNQICNARIDSSCKHVPYSRGLLNSRGTPLGQLLSLQLAPVQKHPGPWWWCLPRTGPRRHRLWLQLAVKKNVFISIPKYLSQMEHFMSVRFKI